MIENKPLVSVIIPCYNCEKYVEKAVKSIINQTYKNIEIFVADDGSGDKTLEILTLLAEKDSRINVVKNETNLGIVETLNKLVSISKGKYIARMDADDYSLPNRIEKEVEVLEKNSDIAICSSDAYIINEADKVFDKMIMPHTSAEIEVYKLIGCPFIHPAVIIRTDIIKNFKYDKEFQCAEDYELWLRILKQYKGVNIAEPLFCYRALSSSISHDSTTKSRQDILREQLQSLNKAIYNEILARKDISLLTKACITAQYRQKNIYLLFYYCSRIFSKLIRFTGICI